MKKIYIISFLASFFIGNAQIDWKRSSANANYPIWMGTSNTERGIGALNDKMYVVTRNGSTKIKVINGIDGTDLPEVSNYTGVTGGSFLLNDVEVSSNGIILACNLSTATNTEAFKIYRWDFETATPTLYISFLNTGDASNNLQLGDTFSVTGNISSNAVIFAAGRVGNTTSYRVVRWIVTGGVLGAPTVITIPTLTSATGVLSVTPLTISANPEFLVKAMGNTLTKYNANGTITAETIANTVVPLSSNDTRYFEVGFKKYVASYLYGGSSEYVKLVDVTSGFATASTVAVSPVLGAIANTTGSGGLGLKVIPNLINGIANTVTVYTLGCNNGISGNTLIFEGVPLENKEFSALQKHNAAKIFPNPASNEFYIAIDTNLDKDAQAFIYDIQGRQIKSVNINSSLQTVTIQDLNAVEYLVKIINGKNITTTKLLKK